MQGHTGKWRAFLPWYTNTYQHCRHVARHAHHAIEIIASKLPGSCKMYLTRHNEELKKNAQAIRLAQARAKYALERI
jgi:hypothetical protein